MPWPLIAIAAMSFAWLTSRSDFSQRLEYEFADTGTRLLLHEVDSEVVIVGIDSRSLATLREWPWPRRYHAQLIDKLAQAAPRKLFIDIDFSSQSNEEDDRQLESALARWDSAAIILPAFLQPNSSSESEVGLTEPLPILRQHVVTASVNLSPSADGLVRSMRSAWIIDGQTLPTVATALNGMPPSGSGDNQIDFTIDPASFSFVSYSEVLADRIPAEYFAEKTVFVGATAIELGDMVPVPLHKSLPGVVVQALAFESARDGIHKPLASGLYWPLLAAWTILLCFLFSRQSWRRNTAILGASFAFTAAAWLYAYTALATVIGVVPFALAAITAYLMMTLRSLEAETLRAIAYAIGFRKRDALLKSIVLSSTDCIVCIDAKGLILTANPAAASLFSCPTDTLIGESILEFIPSLLSDASGEQAETFAQLSNTVAECAAKTKAGDCFPVELSISRVRLKDEQLYTAIVRDISERKAQQRQLQFQATHDPLTTLPNRSALAAHLDSRLANDKSMQPVALMMIDLNRFKEVNDTLGHNVGDYVLHEAARRLEVVARNRGFIARIGGDEFALVVDNFNDTAEIAELSQELLDCLRKPIETCGIAIDIGLSIGIALCPRDADDAETLFKRSDVAMYVAKRSSSGFEFYDAAKDRHSVRRLTIVTRLRKAIAENQLQLHYQPQINLGTGRVESVEALVRWNDAVLGKVGPDEFIGLAETTDLIKPLSQWTFVQAFRQSVCWRDQGLDLRVAINVSARMLQDVSLPARLDGLMKETGATAGQIELEITESAMMIDPDRALRTIEKLSRLGVFISIDDYGTGYSSLAYLRDLPAHALKLDKSFVMNMRSNEDDRVIVASTVQMAHALNLKMVAEGVETAEDAAVLRDYKYDFAQGYLYSAALTADALLQWVRDFNSDQEVRLRSRAQ